MVEERVDEALLEKLREEIRTARSSILDLRMRMEHIRLQVIPQVMADYQLKVGCWEIAQLEAELAGRRARRRLACVQACVNRGEAIDDSAVEAKLDEELAEWLAKAEQARQSYEQAMAAIATSRPLTQAESRELRRLYRTLMRRLHPDVCLHPSEETNLFFALARAAYEAGDLAALRSLEVATRHLEGDEDDLAHVSDTDALEVELGLARIEEESVRAQLEQLEGCDEMRLARNLEDPEWVNAKVASLRDAVEAWREIARECASRERMLRGGSDGR